jgi:fibronectin-binding autotransporter adhesin
MPFRRHGGGGCEQQRHLDLSGFSDSINGLSGSGTVDTVSGGTPTPDCGANGDGGTFSGIIQNSSGTLSLAKAGSGVEVLGNSSTYSGNTTIANGTLTLGAANTLPDDHRGHPGG